MEFSVRFSRSTSQPERSPVQQAKNPARLMQSNRNGLNPDAGSVLTPELGVLSSSVAPNVSPALPRGIQPGQPQREVLGADSPDRGQVLHNRLPS